VVKQQWQAHSLPLQPIIKKGFTEACKSVFSSGGLHNKNRSQIKAPRSKELWVGFIQEAAVMSHSHHLWHDPSQATFMWLTAS